jgi:hypothetical protein
LERVMINTKLKQIYKTLIRNKNHHIIMNG